MITKDIELAFTLVASMKPNDPDNYIKKKLVELESQLKTKYEKIEFGDVWEAYEANL